jgi:predicted DNA-binding protein (MmcQ/YjbR family)
MKPPAKTIGRALRERALSYPDTREEFPWGESVVKVRGKVFIFLGHGEDQGLSFSVKLPHSNAMALLLPFAAPTGYGLGKSGWVTATFTPSEKPPLAMLLEWLEESYRAVAPSKLVATLDAGGEGSAPPKRAAAGKKTTTAKAPARTTSKPRGAVRKARAK